MTFVLMCWWHLCWCVDVLMCWCVDVLMCWCVDVLMCWCLNWGEKSSIPTFWIEKNTSIPLQRFRHWEKKNENKHNWKKKKLYSRLWNRAFFFSQSSEIELFFSNDIGGKKLYSRQKKVNWKKKSSIPRNRGFFFPIEKHVFLLLLATITFFFFQTEIFGKFNHFPTSHFFSRNF